MCAAAADSTWKKATTAQIVPSQSRPAEAGAYEFTASKGLPTANAGDVNSVGTRSPQQDRRAVRFVDGSKQQDHESVFDARRRLYTLEYHRKWLRIEGDVGEHYSAGITIDGVANSFDGWQSKATLQEVFVRACSDLDIGLVKLLIPKGVNVNAPHPDGYRYGLIAAAGKRHGGNKCKDVVLLLLEVGANVCSRDRQGWTALHWAATQGVADVAQSAPAIGPGRAWALCKRRHVIERQSNAEKDQETACR